MNSEINILKKIKLKLFKICIEGIFLIFKSNKLPTFSTQIITLYFNYIMCRFID